MLTDEIGRSAQGSQFKASNMDERQENSRRQEAVSDFVTLRYSRTISYLQVQVDYMCTTGMEKYGVRLGRTAEKPRGIL